MPKLFILGDSFSYPHTSTKDLWPVVAGKKLSKEINKDIEVINYSFIGANQDFLWKNLDVILNEITPEDYLVVVLTSCDRFWFIENRPELSNLMSSTNIYQATNDTELQTAIFGFMTKIWRPSLSMQWQDHRLGYLSYHVIKKQLRKPLILKGFEWVIDQEERFSDLIFSKHSLAKIQLEEFEKFDGKFTGGDVLMAEKYWHHIDCRYNHLCLSNHLILGEKLADALKFETNIDLGSNDFHKKIITEKNCKSEDLAQKEFSPRYFNEMINNSVRQKLGAKSFGLYF